MTRPDHRSPGRGSSIRKSVLFCPACGHESLVDGDWIVRETHENCTTICPDCEAVVTERPSTNGRHERPRPTWTAWADVWTRWLRAWA